MTARALQNVPKSNRFGSRDVQGMQRQPVLSRGGDVKISDQGAIAMDIKPCGSRPSVKPSPDYFTGSVRLDALLDAPEPARVRSACVTFEPGARTAWHTHPLGQTLVVTSGSGLAQTWGEPIREIRAGDVVWFPPGEKHWHGASATVAMTHIAIQEALDGKAVDWMEPVTDNQYHGE
jgi:quercetin dioxygenase-like cupin family protein